MASQLVLKSFSKYKTINPKFNIRFTAPSQVVSSKLKIILFTNARDEPHIKEWATHHLLLGFDIVYIFDHKSICPIKNEFANFRNRVIVERCEMENPVKIPLMNRASQIAKSAGAHWFIYLDADEFIILNNYSNIRKMILDFPLAQSIALNWLYFGTNNHVREPAGLILENYTKSESHLDIHVKTFVKTQFVINCGNPHYYKMQHGSLMVSINRQIMNPLELSFNRWNVEYSKSPAYIAHYINQSEESYVNRKLKLPKDDIVGMRERDTDLHKKHNDVTNMDPANKYASLVKEFLSKIG